MLDSLTSLRFFAALTVFLWHAKWFSGFQLGYVGVSFFYVLSGFILTYTYRERLKAPKRPDIVNFYVARFAKIYPVHILTLVLAIPLTIGMLRTESLGQSAMKLGACVFLIQSFVRNSAYNFAFNGVAWSLSDEMFFYLTFPLILIAAGFIRRRVGNVGIAATMALGWPLFAALLLTHTAGVDDWRFYVFPLVRVYDFVMGVMLGHLFLDGPEFKFKRIGWSFLELASVCLLVLLVSIAPHLPQVLRFSVAYIPAWCLMIYVFAFQRGFITQLLSNRMLVFLGEASFSFYMIHQLVLRYVAKAAAKLTPLAPHASEFGCQLLALVLSIIGSGFLYVLYEEPLRKRIRSAVGSRRVAPSQDSDSGAATTVKAS